MTLSKIDNSNLWDQVYNALKNGIVHRDFEPNQKLSIPELSQMLGVSRTPIRDALNRLEMEGLVRTVAKVGTFVVAVDTEEFHEVIDSRFMIDCWVADKLPRLPERQIAETAGRMETILERSETALQFEQGTIYKPVDYDMEFHTTYLMLGGNRKLVEQYRSLLNYRFLSRPEMPISRDMHAETIKQHRLILEALLNREPDGLKQQIGNHLHYSASNVMNWARSKE